MKRTNIKKTLFTVAISLAFVSTSYAQDVVKTDANGNKISIQYRKKKGYFNTTHIGMLMGNRTTISQMYYYPYYPSSSSYYPMPILPTYYDTEIKLHVSPSITMTNGYMFNEHWAAGIGAGFEILNYNSFPLFADIRYILWDDKISPYFSFKTGYAFSLSGTKLYDGISISSYPYYINNADVKNHGGLMLHPEIGVKVPLSEKYDLLFTAAYRYQALKLDISKEYDSNSFDRWVYKEKLSKLSFGIAIMFR